MAQEFLDGSKVTTGGKPVSSCTMPKGVGGDPLINSCLLDIPLNKVINGFGGYSGLSFKGHASRKFLKEVSLG